MAYDSYAQPDFQLAGRTGGRYRLESLLGTGALGLVYLARQESLGRHVAIKFLREPFAHQPEFVAGLRREARAGCRIEHHNVARTYDIGHDQDGRCFLVMELLRGASLDRILAKVPRPPLPWTVSIVAQVLAGAAAAHEAGVIHRDIKPANVMIETTLDDDDEPIDLVKLCDFGISDITDNDACADSDDEQGFNSNACGTPNYMSPEQALGRPCTVQTDIYSCGVMLFELVTGQLPFDGPTPQVTAAMHVHQAPPRPRSIRRDIHPALERIILRALSKHPEERFASARQMRAALLALPYAQQTTSLLDSWADGPSRRPVPRPAPSLLPLHKPFTRPSRAQSAAALLGACAITLGAALAWQHMPLVQQWLHPTTATAATAASMR